jgi:serine/threonine protein kinase
MLRTAQGHRLFSELYEKDESKEAGNKNSNILGEGSFGKVYRAKDKLNGELVAVKQIDKSSMDSI